MSSSENTKLIYLELRIVAEQHAAKLFETWFFRDAGQRLHPLWSSLPASVFLGGSSGLSVLVFPQEWDGEYCKGSGRHTDREYPTLVLAT